MNLFNTVSKCSCFLIPTAWQMPADEADGEDAEMDSLEQLLLLFRRSVVSNSAAAWAAASQASLSFTVSQSFLKLTSID